MSDEEGYTYIDGVEYRWDTQPARWFQTSLPLR